MRKLLKALALAMCAAVALSAAPAAAKKKHKKATHLGPVVTATATGNSTANVDAISTAIASCPSHTRVVSGGFSAPFVSGSQLVVYDSHRSSAKSWSISAINTGGVGAVTAFAYCRRGTKPISEVTTTATVPSGAGAAIETTAGCPSGKFAISGGFGSTIGPGVSQFAQPMASTSGGDSEWGGFFRNNGTGTQTATTHAYCMGGIKPPANRQDQIQLSVPVFGSVSETSHCLASPKPKKTKKKKGKKKQARRLASGGFLSSFPPGGPQLPIHVESRIVGKTWLDRAVNGGTGPGIIPAQSASTCF